MFERTKISLVLSVILFAAASWALGHYHVPDSSGKLVPLIEAYAYYYDIVIGIGNLGGAVLGGIILGIVETLVVGYVSPTYRDAVAFAVLILILLLRPAGLLGKNVREKV